MSLPSEKKSKHPAFFYSTICHICKATPDTCSTLKRCGGCKMVSYCGISHQKKHWKQHKPLCQCIQSMLKTQNQVTLFDEVNESTDPKQWRDVRVSKMVLFEITVGRKLSTDEEQMFLFPRVCGVCKNAKQDELIDCQECYSVSYCSAEHRANDRGHHNKVCSLLRFCLSMDIYIYGGNQLPFVNFPAQKTLKKLPATMDEFIKNYILETQIGPLIYDKNDPKTHALLSEYFTCSLTILYSLEKIANIIECNNMAQLTIHLVGASAFETSLLKRWEALFHWIPHLKFCCLIFVGPNIGEHVEDDYNALCDECEKAGRKMKHMYWRATYHEYVTSKSFQTPDLIVSFNCGVHEYDGSENDSWKPSVPFLVSCKDTPLIVTSYTKEEAEKDLEVIKQQGRNCSVLVRAEKNPFGSQRPYRDWASDESAGVFFQNNYLSILKSM